MGVVIESVIWEPKPYLYLFLFFSSFLSIFLFPFFSCKNLKSTVFPDLGITSSTCFLRFQTSFLLIYSLASVNEGLQSVFGEFEYAYYGVSREEIVGFLCVGSASALLFATFLGILSDVIGPKKICVTFFFLHLLVAIWKIVTTHPSAWIATTFLALASSVFSFGFETWMVMEHDKADGREVNLGLIYPCLMGARMLGSTAVPWFHSGFLQVRIEDCLIFAFSVSGLLFSIVAYDYQEIGVLVTLFCFFHVCVGIILPSLARLRTMYVPNELRGGMISLSLAPANAAVLVVLIQRSFFESIENSTIMAFAAFALFSAAGCMHLMKQRGKQPHQNWHVL